MTSLSHTLDGIQPWPESLDISEVLRHKSALIQQGDYLSSRRDSRETIAFQRILYRGAAAWELWLLGRSDAGIDFERRAVSALSLAELSGDLGITMRVLEARQQKHSTSHKYVFGVTRRSVRASARRQRKAMMRLFGRYDQFTKNPNRRTRESLQSLGSKLIRQGFPREGHYFLGRAAVIAERYEEAEQHFFALCIADPFYSAAAAFWADSVAKRDIEQAVRIMRESAVCNGASPTHLAYQLKFEWEFWKQSDGLTPPPVQLAEKALRVTDESHEVNPGVVSLTHLISSYVLEASGRLDDAVGVVDAGLRRRPNDANLRIMRGLLILSAGHVEAALHEFRTAEPHATDQRLVEALLGSTLLDKGDAEGAISHLRRSIELTTLPAELGALYNDLGVAFARSAHVTDAEHCFRMSADLLGDDPRPRMNLEVLAKESEAPKQRAINLVLLFQRDQAKMELENRAMRSAFAAAA